MVDEDKNVESGPCNLTQRDQVGILAVSTIWSVTVQQGAQKAVSSTGGCETQWVEKV
jgi:hypothetical protein